jgi:penicillin-binding protein-related factor A (putative recombinase)
MVKTYWVMNKKKSYKLEEIGETLDEIRCVMAEALDYLDYLVNLVGRNTIM